VGGRVRGGGENEVKMRGRGSVGGGVCEERGRVVFPVGCTRCVEIVGGQGELHYTYTLTGNGLLV